MTRGKYKYVLIGALLLIAGLQALQVERRTAPQTPDARETSTSAVASVDTIAEAFERQRSNVQVAGQGIVTKLLRDDNDGSRHQRFILRLPHGQTLLVAHNIDLAPRIDGLREGDTVRFFGEYEWNNKGGVLHWTHDDPQGQHVTGWIEHDGRRYE